MRRASSAASSFDPASRMVSRPCRWTLAANLIGAYVIGAAIALFAQAASMSPEWRLLIITGFCGGLTTFSTFSAEIATDFQQGRFAVMAGSVAVHVCGSLAMTLAGMASFRWLAAR